MNPDQLGKWWEPKIMGRDTKNFRQTGNSRNADTNAKNYARINRIGSWVKIFTAIKFKKGEIK